MKLKIASAVIFAVIGCFVSGCVNKPSKSPRVAINAVLDAALPSGFDGPVDMVLPAPLSVTLKGAGIRKVGDEWTFAWVMVTFLSGGYVELGTRPAPLPTEAMAPTTTTTITSTPAVIQRTTNTTVIPSAK